MSTTKFTATHPTAHTVVTRTSESRTYGFVVWCQHTAEEYRANDERDVATYRKRLAEYVAIANGDVPVDSKFLTVEDYARYAVELGERIAKIEARLAGEYEDDTWGAWSWSSRLDLAEKAMRSAEKRCPLARFLVGEVD
jgi:hypothetical protein